MDQKAAAAYHPFKSAEEMHQALKPRDEIAQAQVEGRELLAGVDLSTLVIKKLRDLKQGDLVFHEGLWVRLDEFEILDDHSSVRIKMVPFQVEDGDSWYRRIIAHMDEPFYVPEKTSD